MQQTRDKKNLFNRKTNGRKTRKKERNGLNDGPTEQFFGSSNLLKNGKKTILCVAEKNSVAREIAGFLCPEFKSPIKLKSKSIRNTILFFPYHFYGNECNMVVTSVKGHLKQLGFVSNYSDWSSVDPEKLLDLSTPVVNSILPDCVEITDNLMYLSKLSTYLILWLDCDREGENIAFEVLSICLNSNRNLITFRAHFSAITKFEIETAMKNLASPNRALSDAVEARKEIDLRVGSSFTRFLTLRYNKVFTIPEQMLSFGTCQFPTLGFVVKRYNKIANFKEEYDWTITLEINVNYSDRYGNISSVAFEWERGRIFDHAFVLVIYETCAENQIAIIKEIAENKTIKKKPLPLNTVEMIKIASNKLKISPSKCINIAEGLYRKGYISYPRTETNSFSENIDVLKYVKEQENSDVFGQIAVELLNSSCFSAPRKGTKDDGSHPPIYPVKCLCKGQASSSEEWSLYELIARHFLATCSKDAVIMETVVKIIIADESFSCRGTVVLEENWLKVYSPFEKITTKPLPEFNIGPLQLPFKLHLRKSKTYPPALLSEAELIDLMDKNGIGTDATMHEHIEKVQNRQYVKKTSRSLLSPTALGVALFKGFEVISMLTDSNLEISDLNSELQLLYYDDTSCNLMNFQIRQIIERYIEGITSGKYSRSYVVEQVTTFMKYIYKRMKTLIIHLDSAFSAYFPKWSKDIVVINGEVIGENISKCGFCNSSVHIYEIKEDLNGLPPISEVRDENTICVSRNRKLALCTNQSGAECNRPLFIPDCKSIRTTREYCKHCKFKKIEIEKQDSKNVSICVYCVNYSEKST
ncbi:putative DNA topoisomerase III [Cryptosporidium canis]|uniref:DNA topoisomerase n=1 Tax=Cryptosporidium canis TaxID=195482 RepID=A0ABQ8P7M2_9CRYT|nr:putative DNA topoisomerase III [Cryptosporidium canis]KAJ1613925.1 putative DNA topoisomerase III [Cryptosporidium canis]